MAPERPDWFSPYVGGVYLWRGREPQLWRNPRSGAGVDCWGLYAHVMRHDFGVTVDDLGWAYWREGEGGRCELAACVEEEMPNWRPVPWEEGAAALFRIAGLETHVGVCTATRGIVLHSHRLTGVDTLDLRQSAKWRRRLVGCFLPKGEPGAAGAGDPAA